MLRKPTVWHELNFYKRSEILYQLTVAFCRRFLPKHGDRTVDQMTQAARSTKQNIVEGYADGQTSFEIELKLLGVARGSNQELLADSARAHKRTGAREQLAESESCKARSSTRRTFPRLKVDLS